MFKTVATAVVPSLTELATRTASDVEGSEALLGEDGKIPQLAEVFNRRRMGGGEVKRRLVEEQMFRLQEEVKQVTGRQELV